MPEISYNYTSRNRINSQGAAINSPWPGTRKVKFLMQPHSNRFASSPQKYPVRFCERCGNEIPWVNADYPKRYAKKRFCCLSCSSSGRGKGRSFVPGEADGTILIILPDDYLTCIDEADWSSVQDKALYRGSNGYVYFSTWQDGKTHPQTLHGFLMRPPKGLCVDHRNGDKTDNRRENLRIVTSSANGANRQYPNKNNTSGIRGVAYKPLLSALHPWHAQIMVNRKAYHLGLFATKEEAIAARKAAELANYGELCP